MTKRFYTLRDLFPLNGAFFIEIIILTYHFFKNEILKNPILNNLNNLTIIFTFLIILNIVFIPKYGLIGAGIATLGANFLYFFLSVIIVLPGLRLKFPAETLIKMIISFIPFGFLYYIFSSLISLPALVQMICLMLVFYITYAILNYYHLKLKN